MSSGHLPYLGLGGAAVVVVVVILFWTRPVGHGDRALGEAEPWSKAAAHAAQPVKVERVPVQAENLPKAEEPQAIELPAGPASATPEAPTAQVPWHPAAHGVAPAASTFVPTDGVAENKQQRHRAGEPEVAPRERPRAPAKAATEAVPIERGSEMPRRRPLPREIDEGNPYADE